MLLFVFSVFYLKNYKTSTYGKIGLIMIISGGLMNLLQWSRFGCVKDFVSFFGLFHFNFYDILVTMGTLLVAISIWKKK